MMKRYFEHRAAAHRPLFVGIGRKAHRYLSALQRLEPPVDLLGDRDAVAGHERMLDPWQLAEEPRAGRHDQMVVAIGLPGVGQHAAAAVGERGRRSLDELDLLALEEALQRKLQVLALHQSGRDPDRARQVMELVARRDDGDLRLDLEAPQLPHGGQRAETGAQDGDVGHAASPDIIFE